MDLSSLFSRQSRLLEEVGRVTPGVQNSFDWRSEAQKEVPATVGA
jgi:hypothetical protein